MRFVKFEILDREGDPLLTGALEASDNYGDSLGYDIEAALASYENEAFRVHVGKVQDGEVQAGEEQAGVKLQLTEAQKDYLSDLLDNQSPKIAEKIKEKLDNL